MTARIDTALAYATARCETRRAHDRYQLTLADKHRKAARRLFANHDRDTWPMLDAIMEVLDVDLSLTDPAEVMRRARELVPV